MASRRSIWLYCEDRGHEQFVSPLLQRLLRELGIAADIATQCSRGGHGRAITEFEAFQRAVQQGLRAGVPDLLVLVIDANCTGAQRRQQLLQRIDGQVFPSHVVGCPEPHIERWCLADAATFQEHIGPIPEVPEKCERNLYKKALRDALVAAGLPILTDEMEYAPELVELMDLYRAGKAQPSLGSFIRDLQAAMRGWKG